MWKRASGVAGVLLMACCGAIAAAMPDPRSMGTSLADATGTPGSSERTVTRLAAATSPWVSSGQIHALLEWAESSYSGLFPKGPNTQDVWYDGQWLSVRSYAGTGNHLGVSQTGDVFGLGGFTGGRLQSFGNWTDYAAQLPVAIRFVTESRSISPGEFLSLWVDAGGAPPLTYQWRLNGVPIAAGTEAELRLGRATLAMTGNYSVVVSNAAGSVRTATTTQTVVQTPLLGPSYGFILPTARLVGEDFNFGYQSTGPAPLTFQWYRNGAAIPGATQNVFSVARLAITDSGLYHLVVTNRFGSVASDPARLTVLERLRIVAQPADVEVSEGQNATLSVSVFGTPPFRYQWYQDEKPIAGATGETLLLANIRAAQAGRYFVEVSDQRQSTLSSFATVKVTSGGAGGTLARTVFTPRHQSANLVALHDSDAVAAKIVIEYKNPSASSALRRSYGIVEGGGLTELSVSRGISADVFSNHSSSEPTITSSGSAAFFPATKSLDWAGISTGGTIVPWVKDLSAAASSGSPALALPVFGADGFIAPFKGNAFGRIYNCLDGRYAIYMSTDNRFTVNTTFTRHVVVADRQTKRIKAITSINNTHDAALLAVNENNCSIYFQDGTSERRRDVSYHSGQIDPVGPSRALDFNSGMANATQGRATPTTAYTLLGISKVGPYMAVQFSGLSGETLVDRYDYAARTVMPKVRPPWCPTARAADCRTLTSAHEEVAALSPTGDILFVGTRGGNGPLRGLYAWNYKLQKGYWIVPPDSIDFGRIIPIGEGKLLVLARSGTVPITGASITVPTIYLIDIVPP